jgi:hypothetical protein
VGPQQRNGTADAFGSMAKVGCTAMLLFNMPAVDAFQWDSKACITHVHVHLLLLLLLLSGTTTLGSS